MTGAMAPSDPLGPVTVSPSGDMITFAKEIMRRFGFVCLSSVALLVSQKLANGRIFMKCLNWVGVLARNSRLAFRELRVVSLDPDQGIFLRLTLF